jgi:DNA-binding transcriptional ArsR family regulator
MTDEKITEENVAEQLLKVIEDPVKSEILTVLIRDAGNELNPSQICHQAGIDLETFYEHIQAIQKTGLIQYTYIVGNGPVYEVNSDVLAANVEGLKNPKN